MILTKIFHVVVSLVLLYKISPKGWISEKYKWEKTIKKITGEKVETKLLQWPTHHSLHFGIDNRSLNLQ